MVLGWGYSEMGLVGHNWVGILNWVGTGWRRETYGDQGRTGSSLSSASGSDDWPPIVLKSLRPAACSRACSLRAT